MKFNRNIVLFKSDGANDLTGAKHYQAPGSATMSWWGNAVACQKTYRLNRVAMQGATIQQLSTKDHQAQVAMIKAALLDRAAQAMPSRDHF